jgi:3D-(3,5/4)-trihydroxycyclohexane-1,2-dione acylhydrolase (decyclizing)
VAEGVGIVVVIVDNGGYASIGALSRSVGSAGFGTHYRTAENGGPPLDAPDDAGPAAPLRASTVDLGANAASLGLRVLRAKSIEELRSALEEARRDGGPVAVHIEVDRYAGVPSYEGWWDVPVAEVSDDEAVRAARTEYERAKGAQRQYVETP